MLKHPWKLLFPLVLGETSEMFLLMPYFPRGTLLDELNRRRPSRRFFDLDFILDFFSRLCSSVSVLHSAGVAHRDLKPGNVLLSSRSRPVLTDLGSLGPARLKVGSRREALRIREEAEERCTVSYRAPELIEPGEEIDERTDVWSLGQQRREALLLWGGIWI